MSLILTAPPFLPPVPGSAFYALEYEWVGWNGDVFVLSEWDKGFALDPRGVEGLHFPEIDQFTSQSRAFSGHRTRGWRAKARRVFWPLHIWADASVEWLERADSFFSTIHPDRVGTWRVRSELGVRSLQCRGSFNGSYAYELDPSLEGWAPYGVELEAEQPFWAGETVTGGPWSAPESRPFFDENGSPPFHISRAANFATAAVVNAGDIPAFPVWTVTGALSGITLGVGPRVINVPFTVGAGETLVIDTDPRNVTALLNGVDVTAALGFQSFAPVPAGGSAPLTVVAAGEGSVACSITPLFLRAF